MHTPLNIVAVVPAHLPLPEPWRVFVAKILVLGVVGEAHDLIRAPAGTPLPPQAREVRRETIKNARYVRCWVALTTEERRAISDRARWQLYEHLAREAHGVYLQGLAVPTAAVPTAPTAKEWAAANPPPHPQLALPLYQLARDQGDAAYGMPGMPIEDLSPTTQLRVWDDSALTDPWVSPPHLSAETAQTVGVALPGSPLTTCVVREPAPHTTRWTTALGIGGRMQHLRGGYDSYESAREGVILAMHAARRAGVAGMIAARGADRWHLWGINWLPYLQTIHVIRAAHKQNAYDACKEPERVERVADPTYAKEAS